MLYHDLRPKMYPIWPKLSLHDPSCVNHHDSCCVNHHDLKSSPKSWMPIRNHTIKGYTMVMSAMTIVAEIQMQVKSFN